MHTGVELVIRGAEIGPVFHMSRSALSEGGHFLPFDAEKFGITAECNRGGRAIFRQRCLYLVLYEVPYIEFSVAVSTEDPPLATLYDQDFLKFRYHRQNGWLRIDYSELREFTYWRCPFRATFVVSLHAVVRSQYQTEKSPRNVLLNVQFADDCDADCFANYVVPQIQWARGRSSSVGDNNMVDVPQKASMPRQCLLQTSPESCEKCDATQMWVLSVQREQSVDSIPASIEDAAFDSQRTPPRDSSCCVITAGPLPDSLSSSSTEPQLCSMERCPAIDASSPPPDFTDFNVQMEIPPTPLKPQRRPRKHQTAQGNKAGKKASKGRQNRKGKKAKSRRGSIFDQIIEEMESNPVRTIKSLSHKPPPTKQQKQQNVPSRCDDSLLISTPRRALSGGRSPPSTTAKAPYSIRSSNESTRTVFAPVSATKPPSKCDEIEDHEDDWALLRKLLLRMADPVTKRITASDRHFLLSAVEVALDEYFSWIGLAAPNVDRPSRSVSIST